jgi:hypothetical protein
LPGPADGAIALARRFGGRPARAHQKCPADNDTSRKRSLLDFRNDIAEYRRNIAGVELSQCRELLLQSSQLIAKAKIFCVPTAVFGRAGLLDLALMKRTPRAQMG